MLRRIKQLIKGPPRKRGIAQYDIRLHLAVGAAQPIGPNLIEDYLERVHGKRVDQLLEDYLVDPLLIVWNYSIALPEMNRIAREFWLMLNDRLRRSFDPLSDSRRLIALWFNQRAEPLDVDLFARLPPLTTVPLTEVIPYFINEVLIEQAGIPENDVLVREARIELERRNGVQPDTFLAMVEFIEQRLQGSRT